MVHTISLLLRLNAGAAARSTFLAARTEVMRKCVRMITFEGSIGVYIADLAIVVFTGIKHTADWFLASFKENEVASGTLTHCVWLTVCMLTPLFRRSLYRVGKTSNRDIRRNVQETGVWS